MLAQYKRKTVTGTAAVSWEHGVHCELPRVTVRGAATQAKYEGRNLFDISKLSKTTSTNNAYYSYVGKDHFVMSEPEGYSGDGHATTAETLSELAPLLAEGTTYRLSFQTESSRRYIYLLGGAQLWAGELAPSAASLAGNVLFYGKDTNAGQDRGDCRISNIQIEEGTVATAYEPYTGGKPAPNPNYPIMPQFAGAVALEDAAGNTIALPELLAIPDATVCDEAEYIGGESWRITRRVGVVESYAGEAVGDVWCSSTGELSDGASVWYELPAPTTETLALGRLVQPAHGGSVVQVGGDLQCELEVTYVGHS